MECESTFTHWAMLASGSQEAAGWGYHYRKGTEEDFPGDKVTAVVLPVTGISMEAYQSPILLLFKLLILLK